MGGEPHHAGHRATTAQLQVMWPFHADAGHGGRGVVMGHTTTGSVFCYDPIELFAAGIIGDPNGAVFGKVGMGKSTLQKALAARLSVVGYTAYAVDIKREYAAVTEFLGGERVRLIPGGRASDGTLGSVINPLDARLARSTTPEDVHYARLEYLAAVIEAAGLDTARRQLTPEERAGLGEALREAVRTSSGGNPPLRRVMELALRPTPAMAEELAAEDTRQVAREMRTAALTLRRLVVDDLRGMFDGQTTVQLGDHPFVSFDLSDLAETDALPVAMVTITAWLEQLFRGGDRRNRLLLIDECWQVVGIPSVVRWLNRAFRLCRDWGVCCWLAIHSPRDFSAMGAAGSEAVQIAERLLHATSTRVFFHLDRDDAEAAQGLIGLTDAQVDAIVGLAKYQAMWVMSNGMAMVVGNDLSPDERQLFETNQAMRRAPRAAQRAWALRAMADHDKDEVVAEPASGNGHSSTGAAP